MKTTRGQMGFGNIFYYIVLILIVASFIGVIVAGVNVASLFFNDQEFSQYLLWAIPVVFIIALLFMPLNQAFLQGR